MSAGSLPVRTPPPAAVPLPRIELQVRLYAIARHLGLAHRQAARVCIELIMDGLVDPALDPYRAPTLTLVHALLDRCRALAPVADPVMRAVQELHALEEAGPFSDFELAALVGLAPADVRRRRLARPRGHADRTAVTAR